MPTYRTTCKVGACEPFCGVEVDVEHGKLTAVRPDPAHPITQGYFCIKGKHIPDYQNDPDRLPFDFHEVLAAMAPRPVFINAPLHDRDFAVAGVKKVVASVGAVYSLLKARDRLRAVYPNCGHGFPNSVRRQSYDWLKRWMKMKPR